MLPCGEATAELSRQLEAMSNRSNRHYRAMHAAVSDAAAYRSKYVAAHKVKEVALAEADGLRGKVVCLERQVDGLRKKLCGAEANLARCGALTS